jgi:hypothetical protein
MAFWGRGRPESTRERGAAIRRPPTLEHATKARAMGSKLNHNLDTHANMSNDEKKQAQQTAAVDDDNEPDEW